LKIGRECGELCLEDGLGGCALGAQSGGKPPHPKDSLRRLFAATYRICYGDNCLFTPYLGFVDALRGGA
jgi:hypothetical protein